MQSLNEILDNLSTNFSELAQTKRVKRDSKVDTKNELIIQHNTLIEARYRLSLQEKRVMLWLLTQIKADDENFKLHKLEVVEFSRMLGLKAKGQYKELQSVTGSLVKRMLTIHELETQEMIQVSWLSSARYQMKKGYVLLEFSPQLKPYLLQLKSQFTKISLGEVMQLTSIYAVRFYELLKQYESIRKRKIGIEKLRSYCGIAKEEYRKYNNLKKDVIERAKKEINEKTDITVDYTEIKKSRKIVAIEWTIQKKNLEKQESLEKVDRLEKELRSERIIVDSLLEYGFSRIIIKRFITTHGEETVKNAIRAVDLQVERGRAKNPKAMIKTAIEEKWDPEIFKTNKKLGKIC